MEYTKKCSLSDVKELQRISQTAYAEAFNDLIDNEDIKVYIKGKYSLDNLKKELEDTSNHFCFFCVDEQAVGYVKYIFRPSLIEIDRLYILNSFKGLGIGTKLINAVENTANINGKKALTLGVLELNKPAISFYEKKGFSQHSRGTVIIGNTEYPLLLMKKDLVLLR